MRETTRPYQVVDLTPGRRVWLNALDLGGPAHAMIGLLEVDVTVPRQIIARHKARTGEALSFTGFLIACLAQAVDENKTVQAFLNRRKQLVIFDDVDVGTLIEHTAGGKKTLMGHVIQRANHKSFSEIHQEIRSVQAAPVPRGGGMPNWFRWAMLLPGPLPRVFRALLGLVTDRDPTLRVSASGTVFITAVGMFGAGHSGWGITTTPHSLSVVVGSIAEKPAVVAGRIEPREMLHLTLLFDHDIVDGGPAARFTTRLVELIESGYGLEDEQLPVAAGVDAAAQQPAPMLTSRRPETA